MDHKPVFVDQAALDERRGESRTAHVEIAVELSPQPGQFLAHVAEVRRVLGPRASPKTCAGLVDGRAVARYAGA